MNITNTLKHWKYVYYNQSFLWIVKFQQNNDTLDIIWCSREFDINKFDINRVFCIWQYWVFSHIKKKSKILSTNYQTMFFQSFPSYFSLKTFNLILNDKGIIPSVVRPQLWQYLSQIHCCSQSREPLHVLYPSSLW